MGQLFSSNVESSIRYIDDTTNSLIFHPPPLDDINLQKQLNNIFYVTTPHCKLACLRIFPFGFNIRKPNNKFIVWSHGNATTINHMYDYFLRLANNLNVCVIAYDYCGYGLSKGGLSDKNIFKELDYVINNMVENLNAKLENITLIGHSLGTGVVVNKASNGWKSPVILISPYKSMAHVLTNNDCCVSSINSFNKFKSIDIIHKVKCPVKIFHGLKDDLIKVDHSKQLYDNIKNKLFEPTYFENADHNDILNYIKNNDFMQVIYYSNN